MRAVKLHSAVYTELEAARSWYEAQSAELGSEFLDEVDLAIEIIQQSPHTWPVYIKQTRRFLLHRFPYGIIYQYDEASIRIFAVAHLRRKPGYWKGRKMYGPL